MLILKENQPITNPSRIDQNLKGKKRPANLKNGLKLNETKS